MALRSIILSLTVVVGLGLLAACGGEDEAKPDDAADVAATTTAAASPMASPEPAEAVPMTCVFPTDAQRFRVTLTVETSGVDFGSLFGALGGGPLEGSGDDLLESFDSSSLTMTMEYAFVVPDRYSVVMTIGGQEAVSHIRVGSQGWSKETGSTDWTEESTSLEDPTSWLQYVCATVEDLPSSAEPEGREAVNGIQTIHYRVSDDSSTQEWPAEDLPSEYAYDLWLAEEGNWPVKMVFEATYDDAFTPYSQDMLWEISDLNDPSIIIEPLN